MKKASDIVKTIIIAALLIVMLIFSFQNLSKVPINFLNFKSVEIPLFIIIFGVFFLGVIIGYLSGLLSGSKVAKRKIDEIKLKANEEAAALAAEIKEEAKETDQALNQ